MKSFSKTSVLEWILTFFVFALFLINFFPFIREDLSYFFWGIFLYSFLPPAFLALALITGISIIIPAISGHFLNSLERLVAGLPWAGRSKIRAVFIGAAFSLICIVFSSRTHFLGDGQILLRSLEAGSRFYPSNLVDFYFHSVLTSLIGSAEASYLVISSVAGGLFAVISYYLVRLLVNGGGARLLGLGWLLSAGTIIQFFGYVENYAILILCLQAYLLFSIKFLDNLSSSPFPPVFFASLCCCLHPTGVTVLASMIYLLFIRWRETKALGPSVFRKAALSSIGAFVAGPAVIFIYFSMLDFNFNRIFTLAASRGNTFLPLWPAQGGEFGNWLFAASHIKDLLNLILLVFPAMLFLPFVFGSTDGPGKTDRAKKIYYLLLACGAYTAFLFFMDYKLALYRDWDLFSIPATLYAVLMLVLMVENKVLKSPARLLRLTTVNFLALLPFIISNASENIALERFEVLSNNDKLHPRQLERAHNFEELAVYYREAQQSDRAIEYYRKAVEIYPNYRYYASLGYLLYQDSNLKGAVDAYRKAYELKPDYAPVLFHLGKACIDLYQGTEAVCYLEKYAERESNPRLFYLQGLAYRQAGKLDSALKSFEKALQSQSVDSSQVKVEMAKTLLRQGDNSKALEILQDVLGRNPGYTSGVYVFANLCFKRGLTREAESLYRKLMEELGADWRSRAGSGCVESVKGNKTEAENYFSRAIDSLPRNKLEPHFELAEMLEEQGFYNLAQKCMRRILEEFPEHPQAKLYLDRLLAETR